MKAPGVRLAAAVGLVVLLVAALAGTTVAAPHAAAWPGHGWGWAWGAGKHLTVMVVDSTSKEGSEGGPRVLGVGEGWRIDSRPYGDLDFMSRLLGWRLTWAAKNPLVTVDLAGGWGAGSWPPASPSRPPKPGPGAGQLTYGLFRVSTDPLRLAFLVSNQGDRLVELSFTSGQEYDLILRRGGEEVWRASEGRAVTQVVQAGVMETGDARLYQEEPPALDAGDYVAEAYFLGAPPRDRAVATLSLKVVEPGGDLEKALSRLEYQVSVRQGEGNAPDQAVLRVSNPQSVEVKFWATSGRVYDFAVSTETGREVWRYSDDRAYIQSLQEVRLGAGAVKEYRVDLPTLSPGRYRVEACFGRFDRPAATCAWRVK